MVCMCKSTKYLQENEKHLHVFVLPGYDGNIFLSAHVWKFTNIASTTSIKWTLKAWYPNKHIYTFLMSINTVKYDEWQLKTHPGHFGKIIFPLLMVHKTSCLGHRKPLQGCPRLGGGRVSLHQHWGPDGALWCRWTHSCPWWFGLAYVQVTMILFLPHTLLYL